MIHSERIHFLNKKSAKQGKYVLYWMQASQRINYNLALTEATWLANEFQLPLRIFFHLDASFPEANYRHFLFMVDGLRDCMRLARQMGIRFEISNKKLEESFQTYFSDAALIVLDKGYLRLQQQWRTLIAQEAPCRVIEIEDNVIVPVRSASSKAEWSARTLRSKLSGKLDYFLTDLNLLEIQLSQHEYIPPRLHDLNEQIIYDTLQTIKVNAWLTPVALKGGEQQALRTLDHFIQNQLPNYGIKRNDPSNAATSQLSPYLHFGQISPLWIMHKIQKKMLQSTEFVEQLFIRRELSHNFVYYRDNYDSYECLPAWCRNTLEAHRADQRPYLYTFKQLERAETHDVYWNAAMREMVFTGYLENTMRMYWGKKIIEWSSSPEEAYYRVLILNNRYLLDGRDPNSYAGVGWCFGLHDRPWISRPVFGTVRYMNANGLERKYCMSKYVDRFAGIKSILG